MADHGFPAFAELRQSKHQKTRSGSKMTMGSNAIPCPEIPMSFTVMLSNTASLKSQEGTHSSV